MKLSRAFTIPSDLPENNDGSGPLQSLGALLLHLRLPTLPPTPDPLSPSQTILDLITYANGNSNSLANNTLLTTTTTTTTTTTIQLSTPPIGIAASDLLAEPSTTHQKICALKTSLSTLLHSIPLHYASYSYSFSPSHHYIIHALSQLALLLLSFTLITFILTATTNMFSLRNVTFFPGTKWTSQHLFIAVLTMGLIYWLYLDFHSIGPPFKHDFSDDRTVSGWTAKIPGESNKPIEMAAEGRAHEGVVKRMVEIQW